MTTNEKIQGMILKIENYSALMADGDPFKAELSACILDLRMVQRLPEGLQKQTALASIGSEFEGIRSKLEEFGIFTAEQPHFPKSQPRFEPKPSPESEPKTEPKPILFYKPAKEKRSARKAGPFFTENGLRGKKPSTQPSAEIYPESAPQPKQVHINGTLKIMPSFGNAENAKPKYRLEAISEPFSEGLKIVHEYGKYLDEIIRGADEIIALVVKLEEKLRRLKIKVGKGPQGIKEYDFLSQDIRYVEKEIKRVSKVNELINLINARREKLQELKFLFGIGLARQISPSGCERLIYEIQNFDPINSNTLLRAMKYSGLEQYKDDCYISRNGRRVQNCRDEALKKFASYELRLKNFIPAIRHAAKSEMPQFAVEVELEYSQDEPYVYNKSRKEFMDDVVDMAQHYSQDLDYLSQIFNEMVENNLTVAEEKELKAIMKIQRDNLARLQKKCQCLRNGNMSLENISKETKEVMDNISDIIVLTKLLKLFEKISESKGVKDISTCTRICVAIHYIREYHSKLSKISGALEDELTPLVADESKRLKSAVHSEVRKEVLKNNSSFFEKVKFPEESSSMSRLPKALNLEIRV